MPHLHRLENKYQSAVLKNMFNAVYILIPLISGISALWLGIIVLLNNRKSNINKALFRAIVCISIWLFATTFMLLSKDVGSQVFFDRFAYVGVVFIPITIYHFGLAVAKINRKKTLANGYALSLIFLLLIQTDYFINGVYQYPWGVHSQAKVFHNLFIVYFIIYIVMFFNTIFSYRKKITGVEKAQANYILVAFLILNLSSLAFLPAYGIDIPPFTYLFAVFCVLILTLAITKYHLFNTKVILTELLVIFMGFVLLAVPFSMPTITLRILTGVVFVLFCIFGYYLIEVAHKENERREYAEMMAAEERFLREEAEKAAVLERELRRKAEALADELRRLDGAKTQFLLSTQHHLRSPLSVVQGYLSMIDDGDYGRIPARAKEKIDASLKATQKLIHLVDDLLDVAHFKMNKGVVAKELTDAINLIGGVVADSEKLAQLKNIYLRFKKPATPVPPIVIDARGIKEAIYNIIDNAIKYTQEGGVTVAVAVATDKLRISVADTGIGMDKKDQQGLFGRTFERGEKARNVNVNGKGIGLYLAAQMIKGNGGTIRVESSGWGKGTEFIIELPMNSDKENPAAILPPAPRRNKFGNSQA